MRNLAFAVLAVAGFARAPAFAAISPTGNATNDTAQIQAAIDAAPNGTVTLNPGTYGIVSTITISNGASLVGGGSTPGDVVLSLQIEEGTPNVVKIQNSSDTVVSNLTVTAGAVGGDRSKFGPGSGIAMDSGLVVDCLITDIKTKNGGIHGGGVNISGGTVRGCTFTKCEAYNSSGNFGAGEAVFMSDGLVENCVMSSNNITYRCNPGNNLYGGTVYMTGGTLRGCLIVDNVAERNGSGVAARGGIVENCTIAGNRQYSPESDACGVGIEGSSVIFRNNIVWGNTAFDGSPANVHFASGVECTFQYNDTKPLLSIGTGNVSADPEFADAANGDYRPGYTYCSDAGSNQSWMAGAVDLDGNARIRNSTVDMGCYEREEPSGFACRMNLISDDASDLASVAFLCGDSEDTANSAEWMFVRQQDGRALFATGVSGSIQISTGAWDVRVDISSGQQSATLEKVGAIVVQSSKVYANVNGSGEFPYDTVAKGLPSINKALQSLGVGGTLYVAPGDYVISNGINLVEGRGTRIASLAGPGNTIVRLADVANFGHDDGEYGLNLACDTAYVNGLTLVAGLKGPYYDGDEYTCRGLVKVTAAGAVVTNCVFRDIKARDRKYASGLDISKGTVVDCLFACIDSFSSGGSMPQGGAICIQGGLVDRTRIVDCLARASNTGAGGRGDVIGVWGSGVLRNSLVTRCSSQHDTPIYVGGGPGNAVGGHLENCTIVANTNLQATAKEGFWYAAGIVVSGGSVTNCIVIDNWSVLGNAVSNIYNSAGAAGIGYTLVNDRAGDASFATAENHNVAVLPDSRIFHRPQIGDYTLERGSAAVNAGLELEWMESALDLAGKRRIASRIPDLGCYEISPRGFDIRFR